MYETIADKRSTVRFSTNSILKGNSHLNTTAHRTDAPSVVRAKFTVLAEGKVKGHPAEPIAWTFKREDGGKSFYTSLGHPTDFESDLLPKLLFNAIQWCLK